MVDSPKINILTLTVEITAYGLAKAVGDYVGSARATNAVYGLLEMTGSTEVPENTSSRVDSRFSGKIRCRTARRWLEKLGLSWQKVQKGIYVDGHERSDVTQYRQEVFLPAFERIRPFLVTWDEEGQMIMPQNLPPGQKPLVIVTHDESTFNANDGKRQLWIENGKQPLRPKGRGKGLMVSDFLTPGGRLAVPDAIPEAELSARGLPRRYASEYFIYGKDKYWRGDDMVDHTVKVAIPIFHAAFPHCQAVFLFDNASNHSSYAADALRVENMNLNPGGKQAWLRDGFIHEKGIPQPMTFPMDYYKRELAGKQKGIKRVLKERGLWPEQGLLLDCPTTNDRPGCSSEGGCCARRILAAEKDFRDQTGRLQEEVEKLGHQVLFYPKFHCELNFIERYWCRAKWYARENCNYDFESLKTTIPEALASVTNAMIQGFYRLSLRAMDAYSAGVQFGTAEFHRTVYRSHRQVEDILGVSREVLQPPSEADEVHS
jgi:hypothetical protein